MASKFRTPTVPQPSSRLKTPLKSMKTKKTSKSDLSSVSEFDKLTQNSGTFHDGSEENFLQFIKNAAIWRKNMLEAECERQRLAKLVHQTEQELLSKDQKIKQAREMVNLEMRERQRIENECEELQRQWGALQNIVNCGSNHINNDTLDKIKRSVSTRSTDKLLKTPSARTPR